MKNSRRKKHTAYERAIFSLPKRVVAQMERYARLVRDGNKSGFVADAIEAYVRHLRRTAHTRKLRASYAAAAADNQAVAEAWEPLSDEVWAKLEESED